MKILEQLRDGYREPPDSPGLSGEPLVVHRHSARAPKALLVFVHGLGGRRYGRHSTWGSFPHYVFEDFPDADVGLYEYTTLLRRLAFWRSVSLNEEARVLADLIRDMHYEQVILLGHSMGGLLCKAAIRHLLEGDEESRARASRVKGLVLMATPQTGSQRVPWPLSRLSSDFVALKPNGEFVTGLTEFFQNHVWADESTPDPKGTRATIPSWVVIGVSDFWVDRLSAGLSIPSSQKKTVRGSHTDIVKPGSKGADAYEWVTDRLYRALAMPIARIDCPHPPPRPWLQLLAAGIGLGLAAVCVGRDWAGGLVERLGDLVVRSGIPVEPWMIQAGVAVMAGLALQRTRFRPLYRAGPLRLVALALLLSLAVGGLMDLFARRPTHVYGVVRASGLPGLRVDVRGALDHSIALAPAVPDSDTGDFGARYTLTPGDRVRALVVTKEGCGEAVHRVDRREWRAVRTDRTYRVFLDFNCGGTR